MLDWFAARPPRSEVPIRDRPSIPLTVEERAAFDSLSRQAAGSGPAGRLTAGIRSMGGLGGVPAGVALAVVGAAWCITWLAVSVPVSFVGVLVQAAGLGVLIDAVVVRRRRAGSAARPAASPEQTPAHRRRDR